MIRVGLALLLWLPGLALALEVGLVTGLSGAVTVQGQAVQAFAKLHEGERLSLGDKARVQLVLFASGAEQIWQGPGELQVAADDVLALSQGLSPQVRQLPRVLVRQLAKTPAPDGQIKAGMVRLRSMPSGGTLESVENRYSQLRREAAREDRNPELYLLASYFELQEYAKLQGLLQKMAKAEPEDAQVKLLQSLYARAISNARNAAAP